MQLAHISIFSFFFSWHLWSVLSSLGYSHTHPSCLASLHCSYSAQLESLGAWQWAVFIAQHIEDPVLRCSMVEGVVNRHCSSDEELSEKEKFLIEKLSVPQQIVYCAKVGYSSVRVLSIYSLTVPPLSPLSHPPHRLNVLNMRGYIVSKPFILLMVICGMNLKMLSLNMLPLKQ